LALGPWGFGVALVLGGFAMVLGAFFVILTKDGPYPSILAEILSISIIRPPELDFDGLEASNDQKRRKIQNFIKS